MLGQLGGLELCCARDRMHKANAKLPLILEKPGYKIISLLVRAGMKEIQRNH